jgi:AraC-like DNA-binding protein
MVSPLVPLELALRGGSIGILAVLGLAFLRGATGRSIRISGALFTFSIAGYAVVSSPLLRDSVGGLCPLALVAALGGVGYCWQFVVVLFEDRAVSASSMLPAGLLTLVGLVGILLGPVYDKPISVFHNVAEIALLCHALAVVSRGFRGDLVESRRRVRGPFMAVVAGYAIAVSGVEIGQGLGVEATWHGPAGAAALFALSLAGGAVFLDARTSVFGVPALPVVEASPETDFGAADRHTLNALDDAMQKREVWRQEGLTVGGLAREVGVPEHVLRRLINGRLGHRNFTAYLNTHRIAAAKQRLSDPGQARTTVAAIAFELGFGSIGPFNRAFREETGRTPTQWRAEALGKKPPNPKVSG